MNILWSPEAIEDLNSLRAYITQGKVVLHILHASNSYFLTIRRWVVPGTRELVIPKRPFIVPYRMQRDIIQILRVYHGARRWPENF